MSEDEIVFKYKFKPDYNPIYVNGAYGGVNSQGEITVNFFFERFPIPYEIKHEFIGNRPGREIDRNPPVKDNMLLRMVEAGVIMNLKSAKELHRWLGEHISIHESRIRGE
jgi:hypothetical protein